MQSIWDLLPASLWPTQPFISPDEQARTLQRLSALQAPAKTYSPVAGGSGNRTGPPLSQAPDPAPSASGGDNASAPGGILGSAFGASAPGGILGPAFRASAAVPAPASVQNLIPQPRQGPSFVPPASTADQLGPQPPPAVVPAAPGEIDSAASIKAGHIVYGPPSPPPVDDRRGIVQRASDAYDRTEPLWSTLPFDVMNPVAPFIHLARGVYAYTHGDPHWLKRGLEPLNPVALSARALSMAPGVAAGLYEDLGGRRIDADHLQQDLEILSQFPGEPGISNTGLLTPKRAPIAAVRQIEAAPIMAPAAAEPVTSAVRNLRSPPSLPAPPPPNPAMRENLAADKQVAQDAPPMVADQAASQPVGPDDIVKWRARYGVPTLHTIGIARTNVPGLENETFEAASPRPLRQANLPPAEPDPFESPFDLDRDRGHAEEGLANKFHRDVKGLGLRPEDLDGYELWIHLSKPSCPSCKSGLGSAARAGILKQLSTEYSGLTIHISADLKPGATATKATHFSIQNGGYVNRRDRQ